MVTKTLDVNTKTLDIYIRVSQVGGREGDSFQSPGDQERRTRSAILAQGWEVGEVNQIDLDESGGTVDRPGFRRVLERIEAGVVDGIAVIRANRFSRSVVQAWQCVDRIQEAEGIFFSAMESVDLLSPEGKFHFTLIMALAQLERDRAIEGWKSAQTNAAERGVHLGPTPVGYVRAGMKDGKPAGPLVKDPVTAPHVVYVFHAYAAGKPLTALAAYLTEHVPNRRGDRMTPTVVRRLLKNRAYRGEVHRQGKAKGVPTLVNLSAHEPLVSEAEWQAAQVARGVQQTKKHDFLLTGFARCQGCGYNMRPQPQRGHRYYRCGSYNAAASCDERAGVRAEDLETYVTLHAWARHDLQMEALSAGVNMDELLTEQEEAEDAYATVARNMAASKRPDLMEPALRDAEVRVLDAEKALAHAQNLQKQEGMPGLGLFRARDEWFDWTLEQRRGALGALVDTVVVRGLVRDHRSMEQRAHIFWRGTAPEGLPVRGKFVAARPVAIDWTEHEAGIPLGEDARVDRS